MNKIKEIKARKINFIGVSCPFCYMEYNARDIIDCPVQKKEYIDSFKNKKHIQFVNSVKPILKCGECKNKFIIKEIL